MAPLRMLSWNVNGLRSALKKDALRHVLSADIICLQETKLSDGQLPLELAEGYHAYFSFASKKGYSGVCTLTRTKPKEVKRGFGPRWIDDEGRTLILDYGEFILFNVYFPNGKMSKERLRYKMDFYDAFLEYAGGLKEQGKRLIVCGDVNTAHKEIDLARPKENSKASGFLPEERAWMDRLVAHGYVDTFRVFTKDGGHYSYWDIKSGARERNVGWRIDYFFITENLVKSLKSAFIMTEIPGSDHCPVGIDIDVPI